MKKHKKNEILFDEIILENTKEINGGLNLPSFPPRLGGIKPNTPLRFTLENTTASKKTTL